MDEDARWMRVSDLFDEAVDLPAAERGSFLQRECADEPEVLAEVEEMLRAHEKAAGVLDRRALSQVGRTILSSVEKQLAGGATEPQPSTRVGETLGPYRLTAELGRGGMGTVYLAHDPRLDRSIAIKVLRSGIADNREVQERFLAEARAASSLDHPNICTIYDIGWTGENDPYIAMAHYEGETLDRHITSGPMNSLMVAAIARQVASALHVAHESGIVHRDLKPTNLLLTPGGEVKMLDFGIAKLRGSASTWTRPGLPIGTPAYMSPEQAFGEEVDPRSDLWSLGVVLLELLTGQRPKRSSPTEPVEWEHRFQLSDPADTQRWIPILRGLLAADRRNRTATASDLLEDLRGFDGADATVEHPLPLVLRGGADVTRPIEEREAGEAPGSFDRSAMQGLPVHLTDFIGRQDELARVRSLLGEARLVTLLGPGGTGKTRLSVEVARSWEEETGNWIAFVPLAPVARAEGVPGATLHALGIQETTADPVDAIAEEVGDKPGLLLMDNFEHVVGAAAFVSRLLTRAPALRILITSRVLLRVEGEFAWSVPPLELPPQDAPVCEASLKEASATRLFLERARAAATSDLNLDEEGLTAVREICTRLDGLPLAIELAAARSATFSPQSLLKRLERRLDLKSGSRDRPERHRTLREAIGWSYELLDPEEKAFFRRLAAFRGSFPIAAAESMGLTPSELDVDPLDGLEVLVGQSLLRRERNVGGETCFVMLETLREFGRERLKEEGELDAVLDARAAYVEGVCRGAADELTGSNQVRWFDRLQTQHDTVRAVLDRMIERDEGPQALSLISTLWRFWLARGYVLGGAERGKRVLQLPSAATPSAHRAEALNGIGTLIHNAGDNEGARELLEESLEIWRDLGTPSQVADTLSNLGWVAAMVNDFEHSRELSLEALSIQEEQRSDRGIAVARNNLGWVAYYRGQASEAQEHHEASLALRRKIGDRRGTIFAHCCLGLAAQIAQRLDDADRHVDEAEGDNEEVGDRLLQSLVQLVRGRVALDRGDFAKARVQLEESLRNWEAVGVRSGIAWAQDYYAEVLIRTGRLDEAEPVVAEALGHWQKLGARSFYARSVRLRWLIEMLRGPADDLTRLGGLQKTLAELVDTFEHVGDHISLAQAEEMFAVFFHELEPAESARRIGRAESVRARNGIPLPLSRQSQMQEVEAALRARLGEEAYAELVRNQNDAP